jgi:hypothetical protein
MIALAVAFYISCVALLRKQMKLFALTMLAVLLLMSIILVLGLIDLRLTQRLRRRQDRGPDQ